MNCESKEKECKHYLSEYSIDFRIVYPRKGEHYDERENIHHVLFFVLEGEILFSYNNFLDRQFKKDDVFFLPQAADVYGEALEDSKILQLTFNNRVKTLCGNYCLSYSSQERDRINYNFQSLKLTKTLLLFIQLLEDYINIRVKCPFLYELKQRELFVLMGDIYSKSQLLELFYPIVGPNIDFRSRVLENYSHNITVHDLASKLEMSYTVFSRKFETEFGETAKEWMLQQKAKHLKRILSVPTTTITDVIRDFGFFDASHFTRYCKKFFGCTPTSLMRMLRDEMVVSERKKKITEF